MSEKHYSSERGAQILIALMKAHGIKRVIASPGTTNLSVVGSLMSDPFFEIYSAADERSACYIACGMAAESGEPVAISCTGATASRNYMPGLTEAYYRKLPILAIPANSGAYNAGNLVAQFIDRRTEPNDVAMVHVDVPAVHDEYTAWAANVAINTAILALKRNGGGPAIINYSNEYSADYSVKELPHERVIDRITRDDIFPELPQGRTAIFIGSHKTMSPKLTEAIDSFCATHDAVVMCDTTSGYYGKYRVNSSLIAAQGGHTSLRDINTLIHIGEISGDYYTIGIGCKTVWRVSEDGEIRDFFHKLRYVFEMPEADFFRHYSKKDGAKDEMLRQCLAEEAEIEAMIPDSLPFSNPWIAWQSAKMLPTNSILHLGILNSLRSWNFFNFPAGVETSCNVGGFGIDGILSAIIGASLASPDKLCFCVVGDLAFFYDLNSLGNRHVGRNLRIMLINNGRGTEFTNYGHLGHAFGKDADPYIAAAGHYGNKSQKLIRDYSTDLGYEYLSASTKEEYLEKAAVFFSPEQRPHPMVFEVFTDSKDESDALEIILNLKPHEQSASGSVRSAVKSLAGQILGEKGKKIVRILREK